MIQLPEIPPRIAILPRDDRGYPCPWFISWIDGKPEFRVADSSKLIEAVRFKLCWVCGQQLGANMTFVIGPMCAVNRVSSEPPSHRDCAVFSAKACPFLSMPKAKRRDAGLPEESNGAAGVMIERNPGVTLLWTTKKYSLFPVDNGVLFSIGDPVDIAWYSEGRIATRAEVLESVHAGLPILQKEAEAESPDAVLELGKALARAESLWPVEV